MGAGKVQFKTTLSIEKHALNRKSLLWTGVGECKNVRSFDILGLAGRTTSDRLKSLTVLSRDREGLEAVIVSNRMR